MNLGERIHESYVHKRRVRVLRDHLVELIPQHSRVLDVGCGDGLLASEIGEKRPDLDIGGIDISVRSRTHIPVVEFDGTTIPFDSGSKDVVLFIDVLHHTEDPVVLLHEGARVARHGIVIKDHVLTGILANATLRWMDRIGNARHEVPLPNTYWPKHRWLDACKTAGLEIRAWITDLHLYPWFADRIFGRSLHFIARLDVRGSDRT